MKYIAVTQAEDLLATSHQFSLALLIILDVINNSKRCKFFLFFFNGNHKCFCPAYLAVEGYVGGDLNYFGSHFFCLVIEASQQTIFILWNSIFKF